MDTHHALRIGEVAELVGTSTRAIRHYHHAGVLPEPARSSGGYRMYALGDVVRLLRVRRLVELGLSLSEVSDALAGMDTDDLRETLRELRSDLIRQEERLAARREAIDELLARSGDLTDSAAHHRVLGRLRDTWPAGHPGLVREAMVADLLEATVGTDRVEDLWRTYELVLDDETSMAQLADLSERFDDLAGADPSDPAVERLAARAGELGNTMRAFMPDIADDGDPAAVLRLLDTMTVGMDAAQARCLRLLFDRWQEDWS